jgi:hypothetical protein
MPRHTLLDYLGLLDYLALQGSLDRLVRLVPVVGGNRATLYPPLSVVGNARTGIHPSTPSQYKSAESRSQMPNIFVQKTVYRRGSTPAGGFPSDLGPKTGAKQLP